MNGERMCADHEKARLLGDERGEDVTVVFVQRSDGYCSASVESFTGIVERV